MSAQIIDGKKIATQIKLELKQEIEQLKQRNIFPGLATVLIGDDPASAAYVRMKEKMCLELGIVTKSIREDGRISQEKLLEIIDDLSNDKSIHGILVQLPLPKHIDETIIINAIPPEKDVDGFHPINWGKMVRGEECFLPCTPAGIKEMLNRSGFSPEKKHVVIVGRSKIVGLPLANMLVQKVAGANATVTVCHSGTQNLSEITRQADILVVAAGKPQMVDATMVSEKAVVIDVGVNRVEAPETKRGYKLVGDVDFDSVAAKVRAISPVPGGVGPMTIIMLMKNTVKAAKLQS